MKQTEISLLNNEPKTTSATNVASSCSTQDVEEHVEASKVPKIEIIEDDDEAENDNDQDNDNQLEKSHKKLESSNVDLTTTIDLDNLSNSEKPVDDLEEDTATFKQSVERFGTLLGEELVNSYWRRGFDQTKSLYPNNLQQQHHHHQQHHHQQQHHHHQQQQQHQQHQQMMMQQAVHQPVQHHHHQQQQHHIPPQPPCGPSSTTLLSQLVNSTFSTPNSNTQSQNSLRSTDGFAHQQSHHHGHHHHHPHLPHHQLPPHLAEQHDKSSMNHHDSSASSASTPNLQDQQRNNEDHHNLSINGSLKNLEDNNNSLCATPTSHLGGAGHPHHLPHGFLPGLPFQFQERGHFRFADDLQLPPGTSMAGRLGESLIPKGDPMEAKLQEMLRYNMDKYANQALDTLHISRRVRELLSVHNIGQRIFAKYILGLSQGTVSELLSKPKPWDKLTEKGRDSYRKMHAWSCDDNAVMLLKSLIPKKGKLDIKKHKTFF